jgi:hypothetical protein
MTLSPTFFDRPTVRLAVAAFTAVMLLTAVAGPASAYTVHSRGSYPGRIAVHRVQGSHADTCPGMRFPCFNPWVRADGPIVHRSPATTGRQLIVVSYVLQIWNGSAWVNHAQRNHSAVLASGYDRIRMPNVDFTPTRGDYFRLNVGVAWSNEADTRTYGMRWLVFDAAGDYECYTQFPCQAGPGWVRLRTPYS